jgi:hypothetical protein
LKLCGLDLDVDYFSHGQLYVACSRVGKPDNDGKNKKYCIPTSIAKLNLYKTFALFSYSFLIQATTLCHSEAEQGNPSNIMNVLMLVMQNQLGRKNDTDVIEFPNNVL